MNKRLNPARPALPNGLVAVEKSGGREVVVGILANRVAAFGFDVDGYAPNHYRMVPYGPFGIIVGAKHPVEVRILLDGELLVEKQLFPSGPPNGPGIDARVRAMMAERPQPFMINEGNSGRPLSWNAEGRKLALGLDVTTSEEVPADSGGAEGATIASGSAGRIVDVPETAKGAYTVRFQDGSQAKLTRAQLNAEMTAKQIIAEQLHPGQGYTPPTIDKLDRSAPVRQEMKSDLDPANLPVWFKQMINQQPAPVQPGAGQDSATSAPLPNEAQADAQKDATASGTGMQLAEAASDAAVPAVLPQTVDVINRSITWAPSHGLVAVGVRMIETLEENEPPRGPDAYTYVLFQLNPWELHTLAHSTLMGRVILPSREHMRKLMEQEGFGSDAPQVPQVVCGGNCNHRHNHRR